MYDKRWMQKNAPDTRALSLIKIELTFLNGETGAAAAGVAGIGILEGEAPIVEAILPVDLHTI